MAKAKTADSATENTITITMRDKAGSAGARAVRAKGMVPGVLYGGNETPALIAFDPRAIIKQLHKGVIKATLFVLDMNGKKQEAVVKDFQLNLLNELPTHVDFQRVLGDSVIRIMVPVRFINAEICAGIKNGGVLTVVRNDVELLCRPHAIPRFIEVDLANFKMGQAIKISHFKLPDGVKPVIKDRDFTIATIATPRGMDVDADIQAEKAQAVSGAGVAPADGAATAEGAATEAAAGADAAKGDAAKAGDAKADKK